MDPQNPDGYIAQFKELTHHAGYNINDPLTLGLFTKGLPHQIYQKIYQFDSPTTFEQWREAVLKRQEHWFHMEAQKNLDKFKSNPAHPSFGH